MFSAGAPSADQPNEMRLTEDSVVLKCLLRYLDPKKIPIGISINKAMPFLETCRKYDVPTIAKRWEDQVMTKWWLADEVFPLPIECLAISAELNLDQLARLTLRELVKAPLTNLETEFVPAGRWLLHLMKLRADRIDWFERKFGNFLITIPSTSCAHAGIHTSMFKSIIWIIRDLSQEPSWKVLSRHLLDFTCPCGYYEGSEALFNAWKADIAD